MCKGKNLNKVIKLSPTPPANAFLTKGLLKNKESFFPLEVNFCLDCGQLQLTHVVSPMILFKNYVYVSSTSPVFVNHFEAYAKDLIKRFKLNKKSLVIDIGSNDGILLKPLKKAGVKIIGIDPAINIARKATKEGIKTFPNFLSVQLAKNIVNKFGQANVVCANNVFAHIHNLDEIIESVKILIKNEGVFVIEFPYIIDFIEKNYFDLIYHEHLSYLSIRCLISLFKRHNMEIFDAKKVSSHGGSLRVYIKKTSSKYEQSSSTNKIQPIIKKFIDEEKKLGLDNVNTYLRFARRIEENRKKMIKLLKQLKSSGKTIAGYGAPAKGNTLLNYFRIGPKILDYIVDDSKYKQGLYTPGTHILVVPFDKISKSKPDYMFLLAWNFAEPLMKKLSDFEKSGGRFIVPVPEAKII